MAWKGSQESLNLIEETKNYSIPQYESATRYGDMVFFARLAIILLPRKEKNGHYHLARSFLLEY